jgi:hypothetical protein
MNSRKTFCIALLSQILLAGCMEEFDPPSLIDKPRPIGAVVQVDGDPGRSTPRPGESATVTWLMVAPGEMPALSWSFAVCRWGMMDQASACAPAPLAVASGQGTPAFQVVVPSEEVLAGAERLTVYGQICEDGVVVDGVGCSGAGTAVTVDIHVQRGEQGNHIPAIAARPFWLDGAPWVDGAMGCVPVGSKGHVITLRMLAEDRELDAAMAREILQVSQFTTAGKLDHSYNFVESSDESPASDLEVRWDAPEVMPVDGIVRFTFVARDFRGGLGFTTRRVCVQ